ncbi:hypothetical protein [Lentilactobacillus farraginis]|nr:hypothetical protein [Lentilactobacillus farraginis]
MKNKKKYNWFWPTLALVAVISPFLIQVLMTSLLANVPGGSNDGWLGFWGGYLGAIISIVGVYQAIKVQHQDNKDEIVASNRPFLSCITQYGVKVNDWVYHSSTSIDFDRFYGNFFRLENLSTRPAVNIIFAVFEEGTGRIVDVIIIPSLVQKAVLVSYRYPKREEFKKEKIEIVYKTVDENFGRFTQTFSNNETLKIPKTTWGENAKKEYNKLKAVFNKHNLDHQNHPFEIWHQNFSIFSPGDVKYYDRVHHDMIKKKYHDLFDDDKNSGNEDEPKK